MDTSPRLLTALANLNKIGAAVNRMKVTENGLEEVLRLIADGIVQAIPGAAALICTYDEQSRSPGRLCINAGEPSSTMQANALRPDSLGGQAISRRQRTLSYEEPRPAAHPTPAAAACPLIVAGQVLGVLLIDRRDKAPFTPIELALLDNFANQAAISIHHARQWERTQRDLLRKEKELERLRRAGLLISSRLRLEDTLEAILQMALEVTEAQYGIFRLVDKSGENLVTRAVAGKRASQPLVKALPMNATSVSGWVATHRRPLRLDDVRAEPWSRIYYPLYHDLEMRSELTVPLIGANGRLEGVLNLESPVVGRFSEEDSLLLQSLATQAVVAIQEARLLDAVQEITEQLLASPVEEVFSRLVIFALELLDASASAIWRLQGEEIILQAASGGYVRGERLPRHGSLTGEAINRQGPVTAADVRADPRFRRQDLARAQGWQQALLVPLLVDNGEMPVGVFSVYGVGDEGNHLITSDWDKKVLTILAHYAALAVQNATRQEALRSAQEQRAVAEAFAAVGDVAANLLHHLNNKVGIIPVRVEGIQDKYGPVLTASPYLAENLAEIERSATDAMAAVSESLSLLRPIHLAPVDVETCVHAAVAAANLPPEISVQLEGLQGLPAVTASEPSLRLVFVNLLENAAHAMKGKGEIAIRGKVRNDRIELHVSDSGPGIPRDLHNKIFEWNFSGRRGRGKLGFGLWWVKTLMARLNGSIAVESDGQNGATFRLWLPRAEAER